MSPRSGLVLVPHLCKAVCLDSLYSYQGGKGNVLVWST